MGLVSLLLWSRLANSWKAVGLSLLLDQVRNLKYNLKKKFLKFDVKCNKNLILAKFNLEIRIVVFCTQEFQTWKALNLINPTKNTSNYSKAKED